MIAASDGWAASCDLASTGMPVGALLAIWIALVLAGAAACVVLRGRGESGRGVRRGRAGGALVLLLVLAGVLGAVGGSVQGATAAPAHALTSAECELRGSGSGSADGGGVGGPQNSLTIIQTSVNTGIVPGAPATPLAGTITNHGSTSMQIAAVTVAIDRVAKVPGAAEGVCDASDYLLQDAVMPVGVTLAPGQAAAFSGASIAFSLKGTNQDACKSATLTLRYTSS
jgi:hypothetical protein